MRGADWGKFCAITCTNVVPVRVIRSELLESSGFDEVDPCWDLELAGALEVGCVCGDEGLCTGWDEEGARRGGLGHT